ncbi:DUF1987 domain-containing protein [Bacteroidales bacterium]|nr:DUF1987 domain-containing protein [Bacteroidales bacterium]
MDNLFIESTVNSPIVDFKSNGVLKMEGKALPEDSRKFFRPIIEWLEMFDGESMVFDVNLYYFNTSVSKQLHELFKIIDNKSTLRDITINWHYEEGDDEALESGEMYESFVERADFNYIEYAEQDEDFL